MDGDVSDSGLEVMSGSDGISRFAWVSSVRGVNLLDVVTGVRVSDLLEVGGLLVELVASGMDLEVPGVGDLGVG
jgi:hypothetical protein